jgi:CheY-like chemotaxis protein
MALADEAFNLRRLLDNTVGIFATRADDKGLSLDLDVPDDLPPVVRGDAARLGQILTNLIGNAVKFTQEGGICLAVSVGRAPGGVAAPVFRFDVTDSGIGIAPDKLDRIFDCFTQADPSTNRLYGGTGLGLAISRSLAELMGGRLSAASVEGQGSVFSLELSLAPVNVAAGRNADRAEDSEPPAQFPGFRVLVVEDDALNQMVTRKMLNSLGCDVEVVEDGRLALDLVTWQEFDLILMDFQMPGLDGPETTRALRAREGWCAEVPVVALTANALDTHQRICLEAGMDGFLTKPIRKRELAHTLASLLAPARLS